MAAHSNRSPSPLSSRPTNPNPRYSESNPSIRRSFSGNKPSVLTNPRRLDPTTPANSPSDFVRRRSVSIEGVGSQSHLRDCEEKENDEKDSLSKSSRLLSPAKGCKNFMAPTISAASKFTPSPRKKVLVERNDPVRTSISLSDGKAMFFSAMANVSEDSEPKSELGSLDSNFADSQKKGVDDCHPVSRSLSEMPNFSEDLEPKYELGSLDSILADSQKKDVDDRHPVSRPLKKVTFTDIPSYSQHSTESGITDVLELESSSIAPLDADPLLSPYDPKSNYLTPRPQFIRYKPNPRVGMLLNKEKWMDPDDSLMAEIMSQSLSDSEESSGKAHKEEMEIVAESADMVIGTDEEIESLSHVPESLPVSTTPAAEEFVQNKEKKPRRSIPRLMCSSLIMMLLIAATCVSISPSFDEFFIKDLSLSDLSNAYQQSRVAISASARSSFDQLARHVNHVSASAAALVFKLASELGKGEKRPLKFMNLSDLPENPWNEGPFPNTMATLEPVKLEDDALEKEVDRDAEMNYIEEDDEYSDEELVLDADSLDTFEEEEAYTFEEVDVADEISRDTVKIAELEHEYVQDFHSETCLNSDDQPAVVSQHQETELEAATEEAMDQLESEISQAATSSFDETGMVESTPAVASQNQETELEAAIEEAKDQLESENSQAATSSFDQTSMEESTPAAASKHQETKLEAATEEAMNLLESEISQAAASSLDQTSMAESTPAEESFLARNAVTVPSLLAGLLAVAVVFIFQHKRNHPSLSNIDRVHTEPVLRRQTGNGSKYVHEEFSQNWQTENNAVDDGESYCASEMSESFQKSASYTYSMREVKEVESLERKLARKYTKRDSLAASSGSPSYGSFTTYERIPIKSNVNGDEEIVTPVRRSSRIRNQHVTSAE